MASLSNIVAMLRAARSSPTADVVREDAAAIAAAQAALADLDAQLLKQAAKLERLGAQAKALQGQTLAVDRSGVRATLAQRLKDKGFGVSRSKIELGPLEIGAGGLSLNRGFMRRALGTAATVGVAGMAAGGAMNGFADIRDMARRGDSAAQIAETTGVRAFGGAVRTFTTLTGGDSVIRGIARLAGFSEEDVNAGMEKFYDLISTTNRERAQREEARQEARRKAVKTIQSEMAKTQAKIDAYLPQTFEIRTSAGVRAYHETMREVNRIEMRAKTNELIDDYDNPERRERRARVEGGN